MNIKQMTVDINRKCDALEAELGFEAKLAFTGMRTGLNTLYEPLGCTFQLNNDKWKWQLDSINLRTLIVARILFGGKISRMD